VKEFIGIEQDLRFKIRQAEKLDENLVSKLEDALCFGKMIFVMKPIMSKSLSSLEKRLKKQFSESFLLREEDHLKQHQDDSQSE
jgi:uncharacterized protein (DUF1919 family)